MAPSTRLRAQPERRVDYARSGAAASRRLDGAEGKSEALARGTDGRFIKTNGVERKKFVKITTQEKTLADKRVPEKTECLICATSKLTKRNFKTVGSRACEHFSAVCNVCVQKQIRTKMEARQLADAHLSCMFTGCEAVLEQATLKRVLSKALFQMWDIAVTRHFLAGSTSYMACLNAQCGVYFSIEGCGSTEPSNKLNPKVKAKAKSKQRDIDKAICPHCDHESCLSCNRPWHTETCSSVHEHENQQSLEAIKKIGAKPCPKCAINIEKLGGCDHMNCYNCRYNFCWHCLGPFTGAPDAHAPSCPHRHPFIAHDVGNFIGEDLDIAQINALIARARGDLEAGRTPRPTINLGPGVAVVNGRAVQGQLGPEWQAMWPGRPGT